MTTPYSKLPWRVEPNGESPDLDGYNIVDDNDFYLALVEKREDAQFIVENANAGSTIGIGVGVATFDELPKRHPAEAKLRRMLALAHNHQGSLYGDDGELQDNAAFPWIDYNRDSVDEIEQKLSDRAIQKLIDSGIVKPTATGKTE